MNDSTVDRLRERLERVPGIRLALLFGSRRAGRARADSDVDVAVLCDAPLPAARRLALTAELDAALGIEIDLVDLHGAPEPLMGEALAGLRLVERGDAWAELLSRHLSNVEDFVPIQRRLFAERRARAFRT